jgi:hypothetical protein
LGRFQADNSVYLLAGTKFPVVQLISTMSGACALD